MNRLVLTVFSVMVNISYIFAQHAASVHTPLDLKQDSFVSPKFYFPVKLFNDSMALKQALPSLAEKVIRIYEGAGKKTGESNYYNFYDTAVHDHLIAGHSTKVLELLDSIRKYNEFDSGNAATGISYQSYAMALKAKTNTNASFKMIYLQAFKDLYLRLPGNREKIFADFFFDSAQLKSSLNSFNKTVTDLKKSTSDSLGLKEAQALLYNYMEYEVNQTGVPVARPFLNTTKVHILYPLIRTQSAGVVPVSYINEMPDKNLQYNLLMEVTSGIKNKKDSAAINTINYSFSEVARKINLHLAAGVPKKNLHVVIVAHGPVLYSLLNNEIYKKKYNVDNPNLQLLKDLQEAGVKFIACGQAMFGFNVKKEEMIPGVKVAISAQTVLSTYQLKNYVYYNLGEGN